MLIAEVVIPQMFTAYAEDLGYLENGLHHYQYFCEECDQAFTSAWGRLPRAISYYERGNRFYCPYCGKVHEKHAVCVKRKVQVPNKVRLSVKTYKDVIVLEVTSKTVEFQNLLRVFESSRKETFRFNISKQSVTFSRHNNGSEIESTEIGNPFKLEVFSKSILEYFQPYGLANSLQKAELSRILKVLREAVHGKLEKHLGHKVSSMFVSPGQYHGTFLLQIFNIAYRMLFPDAPNLPATYRQSLDTIQQYWRAKMIREYGFMDDIVILLKQQKTDFITAMTAVSSLPNTPVIRRILDGQPFEIGLLTEAFALCQNYDYAIRMFAGFKGIDPAQVYANGDMLQFLRAMTPVYGEVGIVRLVENAKEFNLWDCIRLYQQLNDGNRQALKTQRVKLGGLHDWMARRHRLQTHKNLKFNVPEHIVRRLSMQKDRLKFFLPGESIELLEAGAKLHNCVASYGQAMKDNTKWVVLVADDKGKLAACLEVEGKQLVQAKVDKNKPVSDDAKLNAEVLAWALGAKLEIKTNDLKVLTEFETSVLLTG